MSLFLDNYYYDIYVCYAKYDDVSTGWISTIFNSIKTLVPKKLNAKEQLSIVLKDDLPTDLLNQSALIVMMLSSKYVKDNNDFISKLQLDDVYSRIIPVEIENITRPEPLKGPFEYNFGIFDPDTKTVTDDAKITNKNLDKLGDQPFYDLISALCTDLAKKLSQMKSKISNEEKDPVTVFLAEVTDDLFDKRMEMKGFLTHADVKVLPKISLYHQFKDQPEILAQELQNNMKQCHCFIQLLSENPGEKIPDLNQHYPSLQYETAALSNIQILQWKKSEANIDKHCENKMHYSLLNKSTVYEIIFTDFITEINNQVLTKKINNDVSEENSFIFIIANQKDFLIGKKITRLLEEKNFHCIQRPKESSDKIWNLSNQYLQTCNGVIIVCQKATSAWIRRQINHCIKTLRTSNTTLKPIGLYVDISTHDFLQEIEISELMLIQQEKQLCESMFLPFLTQTQQTSTDKLFNNTNPYPGLRSFRQDEDLFFFGREDQISESLNILEKSSFMAVIGHSGCGKSSFVFAGLWPSIEGGFLVNAEENWRLIHMDPGKTPLENLSRALVDTDSEKQNIEYNFILASLKKGEKGLFHTLTEKELPENTNLLIIVDQFEQLFLFKDVIGENNTKQFLSLLSCVINEKDKRLEQKNIRIFVVITIQSDFLGECASIAPEIFHKIMKYNTLLSYIDRNQLRDIVKKPAFVSGITIKAPVIEAIFNKYERNQFYLPLVQHVLMRMWIRQSKKVFSQIVFSYKEYMDVGGIEKALFNHAEKLYNHFNKHQQRIAQSIFTSIMNCFGTTFEQHKPISVLQLSAVIDAQPTEIEKVLNVFVKAENSFLTRSLHTDPMIDICNTALIQCWPLLKQWLTEEHQNIHKFKQIESYGSMSQNDRLILHDISKKELNKIFRKQWAAHNGINYYLVLKAFEEKNIVDQKQKELAGKQKKLYRKFNELIHNIQKELNTIISKQILKKIFQRRFNSILNYIQQLENIYNKHIETYITGNSEYEYDVALSFLGKNRDLAHKLDQYLTKQKLTVFYDKNEQHDITGKNLFDYLYTVYSNKAERCVILYSKNYQNSEYTLTEMEAAKEREKHSDEYIILVSLDGTVPHGRQHIACIYKEKKSEEELLAEIYHTIKHKKINSMFSC